MLQPLRRFWYMLVLAAILVIIAGCAAPVKKAEGPVFYPPPPEHPRIQFLVSVSGAGDLGAEKSTFDRFITGGKDDTRKLDKPYGVAMDNGKLYVCDTNHTLMVFDFQKKTFDVMQGARGLGSLSQPVNISIDRDGTKYVSDPVRGQVVAFDKNDLYVKAYGPVGEWKPVDAVAYEDNVYVADIKNAEIKVFDKATGDVVKRIGTGEDKFGIPTNLAFDPEGYLYVSDAGRFQIVKMDRDGHVRGTIGKLGTGSGEFARPKGIAFDREGRLYAVDSAFNNVQLFTKTGQLLLFFGSAGTKGGDLNLPAKVAIDYDDVRYFQQYADPKFEIEYLIFVTNQFGDKMINVYAFGKEKGVRYLSDEELLKEAIERMKQMKSEDQRKGDAEKENTEKKEK